MKIGFDAKRAFANRTGLGNYSRNLIRAFYRIHPENEYILFTTQINTKSFEFPDREAKNITVETPTRNFLKSFWRSFQLGKVIAKKQCDIYHGLSAELPFGKKKGGTKYIVTVHDLIYERFPKLYPLIDRKIYRLKTSYACKKADRIIAISEQTKRDLMNFLHISPEKIDVVYQNCDVVFSKKVEDQTKRYMQQKYNLPNEFLLTVGTIEKRKNVGVILRAMNLLDASISLVIVGKKTPYLEELTKIISENQLEQRVVFLHKVSFHELPALYQMAKIFIYPSIFEGFGIPILEAIHSHLPVIATTGSCLEEVGGKHSLYFSPGDVQQLEQHIRAVWFHPEIRQKMIREGICHAALFSAENFVEKTQTTYRKAIQESVR